MEETKKYITEKGNATKRTFRLYDEEYNKLNLLEKKTGLSKSSIVRLLIKNADKILF